MEVSGSEEEATEEKSAEAEVSGSEEEATEEQKGDPSPQ